NLHFSQSFLQRLAEGGARLQIRNVRDITAVLLAVKQVDMIIAHGLNRSSSVEILPRLAGIVESGRAWPVPGRFASSAVASPADVRKCDGCHESGRGDI